MADFENGSDFRSTHQYFSNLFNAYAKAFNKRYNRHGGLFERPFKRKKINDIEYLRSLVLYIHNNPVYHGFCNSPAEWNWSSYNTCISSNLTTLKRDIVIEWFDDIANFTYLHKQKADSTDIEKWIEE